MKQAMTLFLCACALPTALLLPHARAEGVITLKSGEKLPGSMDTMNRPYLKVRSSILPVRWKYRNSFPSSGWPMGTRFTAP